MLNCKYGPDFIPTPSPANRESSPVRFNQLILGDHIREPSVPVQYSTVPRAPKVLSHRTLVASVQVPRCIPDLVPSSHGRPIGERFAPSTANALKPFGATAPSNVKGEVLPVTPS